MTFPPFKLERYYGEHEFTTPHMLSASDCETLSVGELLALAGTDPACLLDLRLGYTESQGDPALRRVIAGLGRQTDPDAVVVTNAPEEGVFLALSALVAPGDRVVVQWPCYQSLAEVARARGGEVIPWMVVPSSRGWRLDLGQLEELLAPGARLVVLNVPHNPTGLLPSQGDYRRVLELAAAAGARVFSDEMYRGLEPDPSARLPTATDLDGRAVTLWGTSKSFGLPGLRIGWLVIPDPDLRAAVVRLKDYTSICSSAPGELLARLALESAPVLMERSHRIIDANLREAAAFMARREDLLEWRPPRAGPVGLARLRHGSAEAFCRRAREEAGVLLVPSTLFHFGDAHLRFGLGRARVPEALGALEAWLESSPAAG